MLQLPDVIRDVVLALPAHQVEIIATAIEAHATPTQARSEAMRAIADPRVQGRVRALLDAWPEGISGAGLALALRSGLSSAGAIRGEQTIDIVWTGPDTSEISVRRTQAVLIELIGRAKKRLILVSFAAYRVAEISDALLAAGERGVDIRLVLETEKDSAEALRFDSADAFAALQNRVTFWVWPAELRPHDDGHHASQHAKASIADDAIAFVTSANLTGQAMIANMELGLLVTGGPVPRRLAAHFLQLMDEGVLRRVGEVSSR
jgi:cardiolipin synthase